MKAQLAEHLKQLFLKEIHYICPDHSTSSTEQAYLRLVAVAEHSPKFILLLVEPWLKDGTALSERQMSLLESCAQIHLYARVLDDAIDEIPTCYQQNLLRAHPMFLKASLNIGMQVDALIAHEAALLIQETIEAVELDDVKANPKYWGVKNHHLLILPLVFLADLDQFLTSKKGLSNLLAIEQMKDEYKQGVTANSAVKEQSVNEIALYLDANILDTLVQQGWIETVEFILRHAKKLLSVLN